MTRYACSSPGCPKRDPVTATAAPTCYTCAQPMGEVTPVTYDPAHTWFSFNGVRVNGEMEGPFIEMPPPTPQTVGVARPEIVLHTGDRCLLLRPTSVTLGHDGSSVTLRIVAPMIGDQFATLEGWSSGRMPVRVDAGPELYAIVERSYEGGIIGMDDAWTMTLVLKQIRIAQQPSEMGRSPAHTAGAGFRQVTVRPIVAPPPYAIGDEVEWRSDPLKDCWRAGRVTAVIDDRPDDGIDKPFWIVRVDTAGKRGFPGPAISACLRRRQDDTPQAVMERRIGRSLDVPLSCARCGVVYAPEALDGALHCNGCATALRGRPVR